MQLEDVVLTSRRVGETSGRLEKISHLASCLRRAEPEVVESVVALLAGQPRQGKVGIGYAALKSAWGEPAAERPSLTVHELDAFLDRILTVKGKGSSAERARLLHELFARATENEQDFLGRLLLGELRQGALEGLMVEAIAKAAELPLRDVRRAVMLSGELGGVARAALVEGAHGLARYAIQIFRPLKPMLAQPAEDVGDALGRLGRAAFEWKLDGARIQVHKEDGEVRVYSRRLNEVTGAVPEVVDAVRALPARELILDGEAIALQPDGTPQPFQITMRRFGRKLDVEAMRQELPLRSFFFDVLALDGEPLTDAPAGERFQALEDALPETLVIPRTVTGDEEEAAAFLQGALARGHEGLMAKALDAPYAAGARGGSWLKLKLAHTLDLVVLAAEWGSGRRRGFLSNLHLGARDPANGGFVMLGKTFKGLTDQMLEWQTRRFLEIELAREAHTVYVRPEQVVEIAFNEIQASPHYPGGMALRFARVKRYRPDKGAEDADTVETVRRIFQKQVEAAEAAG